MCSKFIKLVVLLSLFVCCGFSGRVLYNRFSQLCRTKERSTSQSLNKPRTTSYGLTSFSYLSAKLWNAQLDFIRHLVNRFQNENQGPHFVGTLFLFN